LKKVVDKEGGVLVGSLSSMGHLGFFRQTGVCEPKYAYPTIKGEENE